MALRGFYSEFQSNLSLCDEYFKTLTNPRDFISHCRGVIGNHLLMIEKFPKASNPVDPDNTMANDMAAANNSTKEAYMATEFLSSLNRGRYGDMLNELHNAFHMGRDKYPKTLTAAYNLAINWKGAAKGHNLTPKSGVEFSK